MCKFEDESAPGFDLVAEGIQRYAGEAPAKIKRNWAAENQERTSVKHAEAAEATELYSGTRFYSTCELNLTKSTASVRDTPSQRDTPQKNTPQSDSTSTFGNSSLGRGQRALPSIEGQAEFDEHFTVEDITNDKELA